MKTTARKRKASKTGRKASRPTAAHFLQDNAGTALRRGRDTINRAYGWAHEAAGSANLGALRMPRRRDIAHLAEANPLLLGAVGLGLGVAIATLFPRGIGRRASRRASNGSSSAVKSPVKASRGRRRKARSNAKTRASTAAAT
jgi:hypothetical protein